MIRPLSRRRPPVPALPLVLIPLLASCVAPPPPVAPVAPRPAPVVALPPAPPVQAWTDGPLTPGRWSYGADGAGSAASYGAGGMALFALRCVAPGDIAMIRPGTGTAFIVTTTGPARGFAADGTGAAHVAARDGFLDAMAFSRGRMLVQGAPLAPLVLPVGAEISRVIEDCRG